METQVSYENEQLVQVTTYLGKET